LARIRKDRVINGKYSDGMEAQRRFSDKEALLSSQKRKKYLVVGFEKQ